MANSTKLLDQALTQIFSASDRSLRADPAYRLQRSMKTKAGGQQVELALMVILVDIATCDNNFDSQEYQVIQRAMDRLYGKKQTGVDQLIQNAKGVLASLRGTANIAKLLGSELKLEERKAILRVIHELIAADGVLHDNEIYLCHKYAELLNVKASDLEIAPDEWEEMMSHLLRRE